MRAGHKHVYRDWEHGCVPHRRREQAIWAQIALSLRMFHARRLFGLIRFDDGPSHVLVRPASGTMMGDGNGPSEFVHAFGGLLERWRARLRNLGAAMLLGRSRLMEGVVDLAMTTLVDDIMFTHPVVEGTAAAATEVVSLASAPLTELLTAANMALNLSKQVLAPMLMDLAQNRPLLSAGFNGEALLLAHALPARGGPPRRCLQLGVGHARPGVVAAAALGGAPPLVLARVQAMPLTGLEAHPLAAHDYARLDRALQGKLRAMRCAARPAAPPSRASAP